MKTISSGPNRGFTARKRGLALAALLAASSAFTIAVPGVANAAAQPKLGSVVRMMTEGPLTNPSGGLAHPEFELTTNAVEHWINAHGGLNGHRLSIDFCDDQGNANVAQQCARQAASNHDVAMVGAYPDEGNDAQAMSILHEERIPNFGEWNPSSAVLMDSDGYNITLGPAALAGGTGLLAAKYCKGAIALVVIAVASESYLTQVAEAGMRAAGKTPSVVVSLPQTIGDYSAEVAQATSGTNCVDIIASTPQAQAFESQMVSAGNHQKIFGIVGSAVVPATIEQFPSLLKGAINSSTIPSISSKVLAPFRQAARQYANNTILNPSNGTGDEGMWVAYQVLSDVIEARDLTTITAKTLTRALNRTTHLNTQGLTPPLNFKCPTNIKTIGYGPANSITAQIVKNGTLQPLDKGPAFYSAVSIYGKGPSRCG